MSSRRHSRLLTIAGVVALIFAVLVARVGGNFGGGVGRHRWAANDGKGARLGAESFIGDFELRTPEGSKVYQSTANRLWMDLTEDRSAWFDVTIDTATGTDVVANSKAALESMKSIAKCSGWSESTPEWITINSVRFVRVYWQGVAPNGDRYVGFQYSTVTTDGRLVSIFARSSSQAILKAMESATLTIRRVAH